MAFQLSPLDSEAVDSVRFSSGEGVGERRRSASFAPGVQAICRKRQSGLHANSKRYSLLRASEGKCWDLADHSRAALKKRRETL
jgi:hypothetical protein